ncbi:MAG: TonB-dependent receptor plug domain-containing protein [Muribaculaceae bacterium]|nr:TonB-dependent receptor plug domain-containing protein [Muribaculaceae bacterium]
MRRILSFIFALGGLGMSAQESTDSLHLNQLEEVTITATAARQRIQGKRIGAESLELKQMKLLPKFGGENDIIKSLTLLPGVRGEGDGGGGFEVRGGNSSQNLIVVDGIPLYNPSHVMGIFSTFNDDALGGATLYKGPLPAAYGGASSAVLETRLAPGDMERYHGSATIGILAAKIKAEGPIVKDKLSFAVAARRSYVDAFLHIVPKYRNTVMNFYDVSARLRFQPSRNHTVDGTFFISHDNMAIDNVMGMYWGNLGASINWLARCSDNVSLTSTLAVDQYAPKMEMTMMEMDQTMWTAINNYSLTEKLRWELSEHHTLEFGLRSELLRVKSAEWKINSMTEREVRSLSDNSLWGEWTGSFGRRVDVTAGVRLNLSSALSGDRFHDFSSIYQLENQFDAKNYFRAEPRLNIKYNLNQQHNLKLGAGASSQNIHSIRATSTSLPFDRFALTSARVKPERSMQYAIGYNGMTSSGSFDWSAEVYYRDIDNVYDFKDGKTVFSDIMLESIILGGKGRSYGAEFMVRKNVGKLTGWVAYTISHTETKIAGINGGRWYDASNNRRHDLTLTALYQLSAKWNFAATWIFMSGQPLTAPDVKYDLSGVTCYYYSKRNAYQAPPTHRLDLSATYTHAGKRFTYEWAFGIYNTYCRYNPYMVFFRDDPDSPSGTQAVIQAMYGLVPSVSYTLKF